MKKFFAFILALLLIGYSAVAEIDLYNMSYEELVKLKDQINLAMWASADWQEVVVPQGVWVVGEDIPSGYWTISAEPISGNDNGYTKIVWGEGVNSTQTNIVGVINMSIIATENNHMYKSVGISSINVNLTDGLYVLVDNGDALFTPYEGKPSLGFR